MITKEHKQELIKKFGKNSKDSGAVTVQVAILTDDIIELTKHLQNHPKDIVTRRSLLKKVEKRKQLLSYLAKNNFDDYRGLVDALGLRK